jgi:hypothetical protein
MRLPLLVILAFLLAACGRSEPPAKGEAGPPGPAARALLGPIRWRVGYDYLKVP